MRMRMIRIPHFAPVATVAIGALDGNDSHYALPLWQPERGHSMVMILITLSAHVVTVATQQAGMALAKARCVPARLDGGRFQIGITLFRYHRGAGRGPPHQAQARAFQPVVSLSCQFFILFFYPARRYAYIRDPICLHKTPYMPTLERVCRGVVLSIFYFLCCCEVVCLH